MKSFIILLERTSNEAKISQTMLCMTLSLLKQARHE